MLGSECKVDKKYVFNGRWRVLRGREHWLKDEVRFPPTTNANVEKVGKYRTLYGWNFAHNGVIYKKSDHNLRLALRRHFCKVYPDYPHPDPENFDKNCRTQQREWFANKTSVVRDLIKRTLGEIEFEWTMEEAAEELTKVPHKKQRLRLDAHTILLLEQTISRRVWLVTQLLKLKEDEIAKLDKYGRIIVDEGVEASLQTVPFGNHVKDCSDGKVMRYKDCEILFLKSPRPSVIADELLKIWDTKCRVKALIFSDDAVVAVEVGGKMVIINADLSSNDSCKTEALFTAFCDVYEAPDSVRNAIFGQILSNCRVMSLDNLHCMIIKPLEMFLPSGIGVTTPVNTFTWICIIIEWIDELYSHGIPDLHHLITTAERVGHKITLDVCTIREDMQFLKHSIIEDINHDYAAVINLGVVLRASGSCRGDLPGSGSIPDRARDFQHSLMNGLLRGIDYPPIRVLQPDGKLIDISSKITTNAQYDTELLETVNHTFTADAFYRRYRLTSNQILQFEEELTMLGPGKVVYSEAASAILEKDYGLKCPLL
jgi:hypothetical protein